jgi:hypothetical protein
MSENKKPDEFEPAILPVDDEEIEDFVGFLGGKYKHDGHQALHGYECALSNFIYEMEHIKETCKTAEQFNAALDDVLSRAKNIQNELDTHWDHENGYGYKKWIIE